MNLLKHLSPYINCVSPYHVMLSTFDIILILLLFLGKVTAQLRCGGKFLRFVCKSTLITTVKE